MEEEMDFSLVKHYPVERRFIILKPLEKHPLDSLAALIFKRK